MNFKDYVSIFNHGPATYDKKYHNKDAEKQRATARETLEQIFEDPTKYTSQQITDTYKTALYDPSNYDGKNLNKLAPRYIQTGFGRNGLDKPLPSLLAADQAKYTAGLNNLLIRARPTAPAPAAPAAPAPEPTQPVTPAFDDRLTTIKTGHENTVKGLTDQINNQKSDYDTAMKDFMNMMNSKYDTLAGDYNNQLNTITSTLNGKISDLNSQISSYQKSYNPTTVVGTSAKATSFEVPESTAGQLGIKSKGTSQFNRKVRNNLKITGVQI